MESTLEINEMEAKHLTWIHSNKFTTPELFHKRFIHPRTYRQACSIMRDQYLKKGFLGMTKAESTTFQDSMYYLSTKAIQILDENEKILVKKTNYPVRINPYERQHDLEVQAIRIAFEKNDQLGRIFWLSDFEMRSGITQGVKKAFLSGDLDKEEWRSNWVNTQIRGRRTPDGYFETDLDGKRYGFTLEYEHVQNPEAKIGRMIDYLKDSFPNVLRLVVSADKKNATRMMNILRGKVRESEWDRWFVSYFERATTLPFKKIWHQLNQPIKE